jgi:hypothetical protein
MTPEERKLVFALAQRKISREEFLQQFPASDGSQLALRLLEKAYQERDAESTERALVIVYVFGLPSERKDTLVRLAEADWHHSHEDVVWLLDRLRDPSLVDVLYMYFAICRRLAVAR